MRAVLLILLLTLSPAHANDMQWVEPDIDFAPPPIEEEAPEEMAREELAPEEKAEQQVNVLRASRELRALQSRVSDTLDQLVWARTAFADTLGSSPEAELRERRRAALVAAERIALLRWGEAKIATDDLALAIADTHPGLTRLRVLLDRLRSEQRESRKLLNRTEG